LHASEEQKLKAREHFNTKSISFNAVREYLEKN